MHNMCSSLSLTCRLMAEAFPNHISPLLKKVPTIADAIYKYFCCNNKNNKLKVNWNEFAKQGIDYERNWNGTGGEKIGLGRGGGKWKRKNHICLGCQQIVPGVRERGRSRSSEATGRASGGSASKLATCRHDCNEATPTHTHKYIHTPTPAHTHTHIYKFREGSWSPSRP